MASAALCLPQVGLAAAGDVLVVTGGNAEELRLSLGPDEVIHLHPGRGGRVAATRLSLHTTDVIVELEPAPLARSTAGDPRARAAIRAQRLERLSHVQAAVVELEQRTRATKKLPPAAVDDIVTHSYVQAFYGFAARLHRECLPAVRRLPGVRRVEPDREVRVLLDASVPLIGGDRVASELGLTGAGVTVAVIDTGIDYTHPDLGGCLGPGCKVIGGFDFVNQDADPIDDHGHGTHVAGIIAANGAVRGVAPGVELLAYKALDRSGGGAQSGIIAAIERALDPDGDPATDDAADVINLSLGGPGDADDPLSRAVDDAVAAGVVVAVAAGNDGAGGYFTLGSPAVARQAITVGASDKDDRIAAFSSRGPARSTYDVKPEVVAPGVDITSTVPTGACALCTASGHRSLSGTSMAAPHVAGAVALLRQRYPAWSPAKVKAALMMWAKSLEGDAFTQGSGRIDVFAAATTPIAVSADLHFGRVDFSASTYQRRGTLTVTNMADDGEGPEELMLSLEHDLPSAAAGFSLSPERFSLAPGESRVVAVDLAVITDLLASLDEPPYAYFGNLTGGSPSSARWHLPVAFLKARILQITFDPPPLFMSIFGSQGFTEFFVHPAASGEIPVPGGNHFDVAVEFGPFDMAALEDIQVTDQTSVHFQASDVKHEVTIVPVDEAGAIVAGVDGMTTALFAHKDYPELHTAVLTGTIAPTFRFSDMGSAFMFESGLDTRTDDGRAYSFYSYVNDGLHSSVTFENSPADLRPLAAEYAIDPAGGEIRRATIFLSLMPLLTVYSTECPTTDGHSLAPPFHETAYYLPVPYPEFSMGYRSSWLAPPQSTECRTPGFQTHFLTSYLRAMPDGRIEGVLGDRSRTLASVAGGLRFGTGPFFWNGWTRNTFTAIRFPTQPLFLSQVGDTRLPAGLSFELLHDGLSFGEHPFNRGTGSFLAMGYDAAIGVSPGVWTVRATFDDFALAGEPSVAQGEITVDTRLADPDPPRLVQFHLLSDGAISDHLTPAGGQALFTAIDTLSEVASMSLAYRTGGEFQELMVESGGEAAAYQAQIPPLPPQITSIHLRLIAVDGVGNSTKYEIAVPIIVQALIFEDGFESGDTEAWSATSG